MRHLFGRVVPVTCAIVLAALLIIGASPSRADLFRNGRFVFWPHIDHGDPVNLIWVGGQDTSGNGCDGTDARGASCVGNHIRDVWTEMGDRLCNGSGTGRLRQLKQGGGTVNPTEAFSLSTSYFCKDQYHLRIFNDSAHGHGDHHYWAVTPVHSENRCFTCTGHEITQSWETAEAIAISAIGAGHGGSKDHCTFRSWKPLPGSAITKHKKYYSDGFISRISFQHTGNNHCNGA